VAGSYDKSNKSSSSIEGRGFIRVMKTGKMRSTGHEARITEMRNVYSIYNVS
jgi:hypothetical protein